MNKRILTTAIAIPIAVTVILLSLPSHAERTREEPKPKPPIHIGAVFPLTGDIASYGKAAAKGIDLAVEHINARGGINRQELQVIYEDDQGQAGKAVAAMQKLVSINRVPLVMGSAASSVTLAICPTANRVKVVLITPISSAKDLTKKCHPHFFRVCPSDVVQAAMMAEWFKEERRKRAAIVYVNNSWGQGLKEEFQSKFTALGGRIVAIEAIKEGDRDMRAQLSKIKAANPDSLYAITYGREGGILLRQAKELGFNHPIFGADVWGSPELVETAKDAARGIRIIVPAKFHGSKYQEFAEAFQSEHNEQPDTYASYSYDMVYLIASALTNAERASSLRSAISRTSIEGVTGHIAFDDNGDVLGKAFEKKILP